jgi:hypothetical protein
MQPHHTRIRLGIPTGPLRRDHRKIRDLLREYDVLPPENDDRREWIFRELQRLLVLHFTLEEEIVYPAVHRMGTEQAMDSVEEARWGHRLVRYLLDEMDQLDPREPGFDSKMAILRLNVEQYVATEERTLLAEVRRMSAELQQSIQSQLEERREQLLRSEE